MRLSNTSKEVTVMAHRAKRRLGVKGVAKTDGIEIVVTNSRGEQGTIFVTPGYLHPHLATVGFGSSSSYTSRHWEELQDD